MQIRMRPKVFAALALSFACSAGLSGQPALTYMGIPREKFDVAYAEQANSNWCWAASIQMVLNYYGISITQQEIVARSYGRDPSGSLPNWAGSWPVVTANLNNWNIDDNGVRYVVRTRMGPGAPSPAFLLSEVSQQRPVLIGYITPQGGSHASVVTAASYVMTPNGPYVQSIIFRDPWPSAQNKAENGRNEWAAAPLAAHMQMYWMVYVQKLGSVSPGRVDDVVTPTVPRSDGSAVEDSDDSFSSDLSDFVDAASTGTFQSISLGHDDVIDGVQTDSVKTLAGASECSIWEDKAPYLTCGFPRTASFTSVSQQVRTALGNNWGFNERTRNGENITTRALTGTNTNGSVRVKLIESQLAKSVRKHLTLVVETASKD